MEEATPSIYYMVSWLEDHFKNKKHVYIPFNVEGVRPFYIPDDTIKFSIILYFYNEVKKEKHQWNPEGYVDTKRICYVPSQLFLACTCVYLFLVSPVAIFRTGFPFVEYCSGSFRPCLQSDY